MEPTSWVLLAGLGVWAALDGAAAGQFMICRPFVTAVITGWLLGDPHSGFIVGLFLEVVHLGMIPAGGARLPEPGPAAIPAAATAVLVGGPGGLTLAAVVGVALALLGGATVVAQRRWQSHLVAGVAEGDVAPVGLSGRLWLALFVNGARGGMLVLVGLLAVTAVPTAWLDSWRLSWTESVGLLVVLAALPAGTMVRNLPGGHPRFWLLVSGVLGGLVLGYWVG